MHEWLELIVTFVKIGLFSFGGGYAMIPLIREETVAVHHWVTDARLLDLIGISQSTPGPIATCLATYIGFQQIGWGGAAAALLAVTIPPFLLAFALGKAHHKYGHLKMFAAISNGIRPAALGMIATVVLTMGPSSLKVPIQYGIAGIVFYLSCYRNIQAGWLLAGSALTGILLYAGGFAG